MKHNFHAFILVYIGVSANSIYLFSIYILKTT